MATLTGGALTMLISLGYRTGLFEAAAAGPATSGALADRAGLQERYVREWLGAMVTGGFFRYDRATGEYTLPAERARFLTGATAANAAPMAAMLQAFAGALPALEQCFAAGGGLSPAAYAPHFAAPRGAGRHLAAGLRRAPGPRVPRRRARAAGPAGRRRGGAGPRLRHRARGHAGRAASRFLGVDIDGQVVASAQARRARLGLGNAAFVIGDAAALPACPRFDVITAFDAVHDQRSPQEVLRQVRAALAPGGVFVMVTRSSPATWRATSATRWPPCATRSASCTARRSAWMAGAPGSAPCGVLRGRGRCWPPPVSAR